MNYELKDKISVSNELLNELTTKGWQEIEYIQAQIANLADGKANNQLRKVLNNLLTSYYVFTGSIEGLSEEDISNSGIEVLPEQPELDTGSEEIIAEPITDTTNNFSIKNDISTDDYEVSDPFEYFVDFDDPIGDPLTDKDLYNS